MPNHASLAFPLGLAPWPPSYTLANNQSQTKRPAKDSSARPSSSGGMARPPTTLQAKYYLPMDVSAPIGSSAIVQLETYGIDNANAERQLVPNKASQVVPAKDAIMSMTTVHRSSGPVAVQSTIAVPQLPTIIRHINAGPQSQTGSLQVEYNARTSSSYTGPFRAEAPLFAPPATIPGVYVQPGGPLPDEAEDAVVMEQAFIA